MQETLMSVMGQTLRLSAIAVGVAILASCGDAARVTEPEMRLVNRIGNFWEFGYWACTSTSWSDGTSQKWCTFHENQNYEGGLPPSFPFDPNEPTTGQPDCEAHGACGSLSGPSATVTSLDEPPPGIDPADYLGLNESEKKLCHAQRDLCATSLMLGRKAMNTSRELAATDCQCQQPNVHNNEWDAIRHAYWQALLRKHTTQLNAMAWAYAHEDVPNNPRTEVCMDEYNNQVGRQIGANNPNASDDQLLNLVLLATLKTAPYSC